MPNPTAMAFAPDGRLFVAQQGGALRVIKNGSLVATPFMTLTVDQSGERGLLGVAFDPDFPINQYVYVYYTATSPAVHNRVSRFTANGDVVVPGSEVVLLNLPNLSATNHNGGAIHFGPDGKLYVAVGENAVSSNSQSLATPLGKLLRINRDGSIPTDNPFYGSTSGINRSIWARGLRNPFTFAFQSSTGRLFINDVGQSTWEEINDGVAGSNYGWPVSEGPTSYRGAALDPCSRTPGTTGGRCAIAGGAFYNPVAVQFPASYVGSYFFADLCGNAIYRIEPANGYALSTFATGLDRRSICRSGLTATCTTSPAEEEASWAGSPTRPARPRRWIPRSSPSTPCGCWTAGSGPDCRAPSRSASRGPGRWRASPGCRPMRWQ